MSAFSGVRRKVLEWFIKGVISDARKGRYGTMIAKLWKWLDGRKTAIGLIVAFLPELIVKISEVIEASGGDPSKFGEAAGFFVIVLGALHKVLKGK